MSRGRWLGPAADTVPPARPVSLASSPDTTAADTNRTAAGAAPEHPADGGFLAPAPPTALAPKRRSGWVRWGRWLMLGLCVLAGAGGASDPARWADTPQFGPLVGAFSAVVLVYVYGLVAWVLIRGVLRRKSWTYVRTAHSPVVLTFVLIGVLGMPAVRANRDSATSPSDLRSAIDAEADAAVEQAPDPVGMKLAGHSDQLSRNDADILNERGALGVRFGTLITQILVDYRDENITAQVWINSSRKRLAQADKALSGLTQRTRSISDPDVRAELEAYDRTRAELHAASSRLVSNVDDGAVNAEERTQQLVDRRLGAFRRVNRHLSDLMDPYLTAKQRKQRKQIKQAASAA
jgi:hypothetical protein